MCWSVDEIITRGLQEPDPLFALGTIIQYLWIQCLQRLCRTLPWMPWIPRIDSSFIFYFLISDLLGFVWMICCRDLVLSFSKWLNSCSIIFLSSFLPLSLSFFLKFALVVVIWDTTFIITKFLYVFGSDFRVSFVVYLCADTSCFNYRYFVLCSNFGSASSLS